MYYYNISLVLLTLLSARNLYSSISYFFLSWNLLVEQGISKAFLYISIFWGFGIGLIGVALWLCFIGLFKIDKQDAPKQLLKKTLGYGILSYFGPWLILMSWNFLTIISYKLTRNLFF